MPPSENLIEMLVATAELCGHELSKPAAKLLALDLAKFDEAAVLEALRKCRMELSGKLTLAAVISRIDDGRPGPEEAWAAVPKNEFDSAVLTQETLTAWGSARELYEEDAVAARMAFREVYVKLVAEARAMGLPVVWLPSLGYEASGRPGVLADAVAAGKLTLEHAQRCVTIEQLPALQQALGVEQKKPEALPGKKRDVQGLITSALVGKVITD